MKDLNGGGMTIGGLKEMAITLPRQNQMKRTAELIKAPAIAYQKFPIISTSTTTNMVLIIEVCR